MQSFLFRCYFLSVKFFSSSLDDSVPCMLFEWAWDVSPDVFVTFCRFHFISMLVALGILLTCGVSGQSDRLFGLIPMYCQAAEHSSKTKTPKTRTKPILQVYIQNESTLINLNASDSWPTKHQISIVQSTSSFFVPANVLALWRRLRGFRCYSGPGRLSELVERVSRACAYFCNLTTVQIRIMCCLLTTHLLAHALLMSAQCRPTQQ